MFTPQGLCVPATETTYDNQKKKSATLEKGSDVQSYTLLDSNVQLKKKKP